MILLLLKNMDLSYMEMSFVPVELHWYVRQIRSYYGLASTLKCDQGQAAYFSETVVFSVPTSEGFHEKKLK